MFNYRRERISKRRIKLIHHVSMLCMVLSLLFSVASLYLQGYGLTLFLIVVAAIFYLTSQFVIKKPHYARLMFMLNFNISVAISASYFGKGSSIEFFLMYAVGIAFIFFSYTTVPSTRRLERLNFCGISRPSFINVRIAVGAV